MERKGEKQLNHPGRERKMPKRERGTPPKKTRHFFFFEIFLTPFSRPYFSFFFFFY